MDLTKLLPRQLNPNDGSDCATLLGAAFTAIYLERARARELGWRGIRPCAAEVPAWTCRVATSPFVYGICFDGEQADAETLHGHFSLYAFPRNPEDPMLDRYPLEALRSALAEGYDTFLHEFTTELETAAAFRCGMLHLRVALDGSALSLTLESPARRRITALDGCRTADGQWLLHPGERESDLPQFAILLHLFSPLAATFERHLEAKPALFMTRCTEPAPAYDAQGRVSFLQNDPETVLAFNCVFNGQDNIREVGVRRVPRLPLRRRRELPKPSERPLLHILTGFLGAGKTTFLRGWLDFLNGRERYTGVIQNEFGEIPLDAALLRGDTPVEALDDGCVCCSLADSLRPGIQRLLAAMPAEQFILETTGLANPENILETLCELEDLVTPGLVITVADGLELLDRAGERPEMAGIRKAQLERADIIILNKIDTADSAAVEALAARLSHINPRALLLKAAKGNVAYAVLDDFMDEWAGKKLPSRNPVLHGFGQHAPIHADEGFMSRLVMLPETLTRQKVADLLAQAGAGLDRAKGLVRVEGEGMLVAQYAAGQLCFEETPPDMEIDNGTYLVLIGRGL